MATGSASGSVALSANVGDLGVKGLSSFIDVLRVASADNVQPGALVQMEQLGAAFLVTGECAEKAPDLLQRSSSVCLDRIKTLVGWAKGDTCSAMAKTAAGQAIAMLSVCLSNNSGPEGMGTILAGLSKKLLSREHLISSKKQLLDVASLLGDKLQALGYGNRLAQEIFRIQSAYAQFLPTGPRDLMEVLSSEVMTDILFAMTRAVREDKLILRVQGTYGMGRILGMAKFLFPEDTVVMCGSHNIFHGLKQSIVLEFPLDNNNKIPTFQLETGLESMASILPVNIVRPDDKPIEPFPSFRFSWPGWIANWLETKFSGAGVSCSQDVLISYGSLLLFLSDRATRALHNRDAQPWPGPNPQQRIRQVCREVFRISDFEECHDESSAFNKLEASVRKNLYHVFCSCDGKRCDFGCEYTNIRFRNSHNSPCRRMQLWEDVGYAIKYAYLSSFITAGSNVTVAPYHESRSIGSAWSGGEPLTDTFIKREYSHNFLGLAGPDSFSGSEEFRTLGVSSGGSTIYPTVLRDFAMPSEWCPSFHLVDGHFTHGGQSYKKLMNAKQRSNPLSQTIYDHKNVSIVPSNHGVHSKLELSVDERLDRLELRVAAWVFGQVIEINLREIVDASVSLVRAEPCPHPRTESLQETTIRKLKCVTRLCRNQQYDFEKVLGLWNTAGGVREDEMTPMICSTSVATPYPPRDCFGISMTQGNAEAQLLCCVDRPLLLQNCCLNCGVKQALLGSRNVVIVR